MDLDHHHNDGCQPVVSCVCGMLFSGGFVDELWAPGSTRESCFVSIGRDLDKMALIDRVVSCRCSEVLRFSVGEKVLANVRSHPKARPDGYKCGRIIKQWDEGNATRIELQDDDKTNVRVAVDEDEFVKAMP